MSKDDDFRHAFIQYAIARGVLRFGDFELKSGRRSPYFFNSGLFSSGASLLALARFYAQTLDAAGVHYDMLFGPAYKGIALVSALATVLAADHDRDVPYAFDRKEAKDHGEGGVLVGAPLKGRVLVVDDVVSAGTSTRHSLALIAGAGASCAGVAVALDRRERGAGPNSAAAELAATHGVTLTAVATLDDLVAYLEATHGEHRRWLPAMRRYAAEYGAPA